MLSVEETAFPAVKIITLKRPSRLSLDDAAIF
jgi:hypothetical protein